MGPLCTIFPTSCEAIIIIDHNYFKRKVKKNTTSLGCCFPPPPAPGPALLLALSRRAEPSPCGLLGPCARGRLDQAGAPRHTAGPHTELALDMAHSRGHRGNAGLPCQPLS